MFSGCVGGGEGECGKGNADVQIEEHGLDACEVSQGGLVSDCSGDGVEGGYVGKKERVA